RPGRANRPPVQRGRRHTVVELVHWSFVIALTWLALDLAWRLFSLIGTWIGGGFSRLSKDDEPWGPLYTTNRHRASCYVPMHGRTPSIEPARSLPPNRWRSLGEWRGFSVH